MANQESPIRIDPRLLSLAKAAAAAFHRKPPEQINYWADLGRILDSQLNADEISALISGVGRIQVSYNQTGPINPADNTSNDLDIVALALSHQTASGFLETQEFIAEYNPKTLYSANEEYPGLLEKIDPQGNKELGTFKDGKFRKASKSKLATYQRQVP